MSRFTRRTLPQELGSHQQWPTPDISQLSGEARLRFTTYKEVIEAYLGGAKVADMLESYGISYASLLRQFNRCVSHDDRGQLFGWHALLPYQHVKAYRRVAPVRPRETCTKGGYTGALGALFASNPDVQESLDHYLLTGSRDGSLPESRVTPAAAHGYFLKLCERKNIPSHAWPFSVSSRGKATIWRYVRSFFDAHYGEVVQAQYGQRASAKANTGTGHKSRIQASLPFDVAELDEHSVHFVGCIGVPTAKGLRWVPLQRLTIIVLADRASRAILSYVVIVRREPTETDVLSAVARALEPWKAREMAVPGFGVATSAGMPSAKIPELARCGFNLLLVDNHLSHLAENISMQLGDMVGCAVNYGQTGRFDRRPFIEGIFKKIEEFGFVRLPSTTGSHPLDSRRSDPAKKATRHCMTLDAMLDLIEAVITDYNSQQTAGNFSASPLEQLRSTVQDPGLGFLPPWVPPRLAHEPALDTVIERGRIGGSRSKGVRPHIYLDRVRYTSPVLSSRWGLIGQRAIKHIREDNIQSFVAYLESGECLGPLEAMGEWGREPHSRAVRQEINAALDAGAFSLARGESPVVRWLAALGHVVAAQALKGGRPKLSRAANILAEEQRRGNTVVSALDCADSPNAPVPAPRAASEEAKRHAVRPGFTFKAIN